jgi:hypothetical protein
MGDALLRTLMYSMGQTAVASMPPATHPADKASNGCLFLGFGLWLLTCSASGAIGSWGEGVATGLMVLIVGKGEGVGRLYPLALLSFNASRIRWVIVHREPSRPVKLAFGLPLSPNERNADLSHGGENSVFKT